jgi:hypothetical protein
LIVIGGVAFLLFSTERQIAVRRAAFRAFDDRAARLTATLHEAGTAQQAYLAEELPEESQTPTIKAFTDSALAEAASLGQQAFDHEAKDALGEAESRVRDFADIDRRVREYLAGGERLMAVDVAAGEGRRATAEAAALVEGARQAERFAATTFEASGRDLQISYLAAGGGFLALVVTVLALARGRRQQQSDAESRLLVVPARDSLGDDADLSLTGEPSAPIAVGVGHDTSRSEDGGASLLDAPLGRHDGGEGKADLNVVADLCTDLGRAATVEHLQALLARLASIVRARGIVVWLSDRESGNLKPVLAYGYPAQTLARMPALSPSSDNAAAAAYRTGTFQIVRSRLADSSSAVVAPLIGHDGCIGVLSAELEADTDPSNTLSAFAVIFAAQLSAMFAGFVSIPEDEQAATDTSSTLAARA